MNDHKIFTNEMYSKMLKKNVLKKHVLKKRVLKKAHVQIIFVLLKKSWRMC